MATIKNRAAREKMVQARTGVLISNGFFGFLAMQLKFVEVTDPDMVAAIWGKAPTMAVDGINLYYHPDFVMKLTDRECEGVIVHEVMHCALQHTTRRQYRDARGWNVAADFVINNDLVELGYDLPKGGLVDAKYKGMSTEDVYEALPKIYVSFGAGDGKDPGGMGGVMDAPGGQAGKEEVQQMWEGAVRSAVQIAKANNAGNLPGTLRKLLDNLNKPKVSWRDKTRNFIDQSLSKDISWSRISRRSFPLGTLMPGYISDRLSQLIMVLDISGSIGTEMARQFLSEVAGALDEGTADQLTVLYADTRVQHVDHFVPGDLVTMGNYTGGGTDFRDTFKWIAANAPEASCVIYLTDLEVNEYGEDPGCPVLWATYAPDTRYQQLADAVPFGTPIQVSNSIG